jgi:hypothetical protein
VRWRKRKVKGPSRSTLFPPFFFFFFFYFFIFSKANNICARDDFDPWLLRGYTWGVQPPKVVGSSGVVGQVYPTTTSLGQRQFPSRLSICVSVCV